MRAIITISILFLFQECISQIVIDKTLSQAYKNAIKKLPLKLQKKISKLNNDSKFMGGIVILKEFKSDTLNKSELKKRSQFVTITDIDPITDKPIKNKKSSTNEDLENPILLCAGHLSNDTLQIGIGYPFLDKTIRHLIVKNHVTTTYDEYYKYDSILKLNINDPLTNKLTVPAQTIKFSLSDSAFSPGKVIYGTAEIITDSYYLKDSWEENQFFQLCWKMKYYFKFKVLNKYIE